MSTKSKWIVGVVVGLAIAGLANGNSQSAHSLPSGPKTEQGISQISSSNSDITQSYTKAVPYENPSYSKSTTEQYSQETAPIPEGPIHYYENTYGNQVQSPTYYNLQPAGASALCRDGTYSFSQSRRGTCSHHGGVSEWL